MKHSNYAVYTHIFYIRNIKHSNYAVYLYAHPFYLTNIKHSNYVVYTHIFYLTNIKHSNYAVYTHPFYLTNIKHSNYVVYTPILLNKHKTQQLCSAHTPIYSTCQAVDNTGSHSTFEFLSRVNLSGPRLYCT